MTESRLYITASAETLMGQASKTAQEFLREALAAVREELGTKTPEKYPELLAALINAASRDCAASIQAKIAQQNAEEHNEAMDALVDKVGALAYHVGHLSDNVELLSGKEE